MYRLRAGDWVEVKSAEAILATLDEEGCIDGLEGTWNSKAKANYERATELARQAAGMVK